jgi:Fe-S cluster assembly protein SufD
MSLDWRESLRTDGQAAFDRLGLPSRKIESWHYTDLSQFDLPLHELAEPGGLPKVGAGVIHLVNGYLAAVGAMPAGVTLEKLSNSAIPPALLGTLLPVADMPLVGLNASLFNDALLLRVAAGAKIEQPITLISEAQGSGHPTQFHGRLLLLVEPGAKLTLIERHRGKGRYFSNWVAEIAMAEGATLHHVALQNDAENSVHVGSLGLDLAANAVYRGVSLQLGARLARRETIATLSGQHADFSLDGATLAMQQQHLDNTTRIIHRAPHCPSRQLFKTVLDDQGHGVFQGTVLVERAAQKTAAHQLSRALMLSDGAAMDNKPELEIYADDVKCGHGATIGDIDENQLFYLRARGIDEDTARQVLVGAFLGDVVDQIAIETLRDEMQALLHQRLTGKEVA